MQLSKTERVLLFTVALSALYRYVTEEWPVSLTVEET